MGTRRTRAPRDHVVSGHWPHARLDGDHAAAVAQAVSARLARVLAEHGLSLNTVSKTAAVNRQTISNVLDGRVWPTIAVLADLERALDTPIALDPSLLSEEKA
ncbi:helix-turn-helix domain-containing protein [Saccharothrix australiensis]|uniref:DNA-binding XRE family transcriptional regulator n=1 Tax=Saccharothrix australiensis TaxID=2072 RepID=A0A495VRI0_9PSEU|nr:helix-turn-helix transcriptional regulator [Saccharothrix australiensis]RKT51874.1 DNA-binding XRE family transcriptional regulator [Saccharothrix australiensis]